MKWIYKGHRSVMIQLIIYQHYNFGIRRSHEGQHLSSSQQLLAWRDCKEATGNLFWAGCFAQWWGTAVAESADGTPMIPRGQLVPKTLGYPTRTIQDWEGYCQSVLSHWQRRGVHKGQALHQAWYKWVISSAHHTLYCRWWQWEAHFFHCC